MPATRYLLTLFASLAVAFGLAWVWIAAAPLAFMEPEFAAWRAKRILLDRCDLGDTLILGDSRAAADLIPALLPGRVTNLAIGGGEAIEALSMLRAALRCPEPPRRLVLSFDAGHFSRPDLFWERSVRFGFLSAGDIAELRMASIKTGDMSVYRGREAGLLPPSLRDWLQEVRFPPYFFASLSHGGLLLRWRGNQRIQQATIAARGHYSFGEDAGSDAVAVDGHLAAFQPLPVLDHYFDALLRLAEETGTETLFIPMPVNEATWKTATPALRRGFTAYLKAYEARYRRFRLQGDIMPHRPNAWFGDQFCHMNPPAAARFSAALAQRLQAAPPSTQNDAQNGWFSETGRDASDSVWPISKRGS